MVERAANSASRAAAGGGFSGAPEKSSDNLTGWRRRTLVPLLGLGVWLASLGGAALLAGCAAAPTPPAAERPPIVFVHGNGDNAAIWQTTLWRFESNGWPGTRLFALDAPDPLARDDDSTAQPGRSSTTEHRDWLAGEVARVLAQTGARQVVLVGNSRGGYAIRNFVRNGGAAQVSHAVLGGTPNHGVWANDTNLGSEFNGKGNFLRTLNAPQGPDGAEVTPGVQWLTLRSDGNDKFAQPLGTWIGRPIEPTNVTVDGPALAGANNTVLPGVDHRETSTSAAAFAATWAFVTGSAPPRTDVLPQAANDTTITLDGRVAALLGGTQTNRPLAGARVDVYAVSPDSGERLGPAEHSRVTGADGQWGPFAARKGTAYEVVVAADGYATLHLYRSGFVRSSNVVHLRPPRITDAERAAGAIVVLSRPRGYLDLQRHRIAFDGAAPPGVPAGVAGVATSRLTLPAAAPRTVLASFDGERIALRTWPAKDGHISVAEVRD